MVDGHHIRILWITYVYRYMREIIDNGYLYIACPPLYKITWGKNNVKYAYDDQEKDEIISELGDIKVDIQRYKGLGEMQPEELWNTTMNPENRKLIKVTIEDAEAADRIIQIAMSEDVPERKQYIEENAEYADIDV